MKLLTYLCIALQVLDGILTYCGVTMLPFGTNAEGNFLLRHLMNMVGIIPALLFVKFFGIVAIFSMYRVRTSRVVMSIVFGFYSFVVVEWIFVLFPLIA